jgi:hypothetical protein
VLVARYAADAWGVLDLDELLCAHGERVLHATWDQAIADPQRPLAGRRAAGCAVGRPGRAVGGAGEPLPPRRGLAWKHDAHTW